MFMSNFSTDTIAAIATAPGEAGVAIIRVSGPEAFRIADDLFHAPPPRPSERSGGTFSFGRIQDPDGSVVDDVLMLVMRAPHSYTGEDTIEFQGHGGTINARRILRRTLDAGARLADPGEFTRRAFLNGRIDLLQAEAVLDLIHAKSDRAAHAAVEQLEGHLSRQFNALYDQTVQIAANLEATLDFPDEELPKGILEGIAKNIQVINYKVDILINTHNEGHLLREGATLVISGKPNVGKSTLLNSLTGRDRAIVSPLPGTTRDSIEESYVLGGYPIRLIDTAGIRETDCEIELEGVRRSHRHMERADLHIVMIEAQAPMDAAEDARLRRLPADRVIVVLNKSDQGLHNDHGIPAGITVVVTSLVRGEGLEDLKRAIVEKLDAGSATAGGQHAAIAERHREILVRVKEHTARALEILGAAQPDGVALAASELRQGLEHLGQATGRTYHDELLNSIFSRFCIGK